MTAFLRIMAVSGLLFADFGHAAPVSFSRYSQTAAGDYFLRLQTERVNSDTIVRWHSIGPGMSGYNEELWPHPTDPRTLLMGPDMHVSYGSWDGGDSWHSLQDADGLGQDMKRVIDIDFSRQNPDFGMAIDWNGWVYRTLDRGRTWARIAELTPSALQLGYNPYNPSAFTKGWYDEQLAQRLSTIAVDPTNDRVWFIGPGNFFDVKDNHRSRAAPDGRRAAYAAYGYILKSTDGGQSWHKIEHGLPPDLEVGRFIVNAGQPLELAMISNHGFARSEDGGQSWDFRNTGLPNDMPRDMTAWSDARGGRTTLYVVEQTVFTRAGNTVQSRGGVFRSDDFGRSWHDITGDLAIDLTRLHYPQEISRYYRAIGFWFGISPEAARKTFPQLPQSVLPVFNRIAVNPRDPNDIFVTYNKKHDYTFGPGEVWSTCDGGAHWHASARDGAYWHNGTDADYWRSRGNPIGANVEFSHLESFMDSKAESSGNRLLAIGPTGDIYISVDQQTLRSRDNGTTWQQIDDIALGNRVWIGRGDSDLPGRYLVLETGKPDRRLLASGEHGIWETIAPPAGVAPAAVPVRQIEGQVHIDGMMSVSTLAVSPVDPQVIYALSWRQEHAGKLRRTEDGGRHWTDIATIFKPIDLRAMSQSRRRQAERLAATGKGPPGLLPAQNSLTIDPQHPRYMYFVATRDAASEIYRGPRAVPAMGGFGFYRSSDGGYHWKLANKGFKEGASLRRLILDPTHPNILFVAANGEQGGLYKSTDRGLSWQRIGLPEAIRSVNNVFIDRQTHAIYIATGRYYAGGMDEGGAWRSADGGATWQRIFAAPLVTQIESSPVDPNLLLTTVTQQLKLPRTFMNPGLFLSFDAGQTWHKINDGLANHDKIFDAKPDPYNRNVLWAAGWGSGWYVGYIGEQAKRGWYTLRK